MTYTPTLADIPMPAKQGRFVPTLADIDVADKQIAAEKAARNPLTPANLGRAAIGIGGDIATGVAKGTSGLLGMIPGISELEQKFNLSPKDMSNPAKSLGIGQNTADKFITGAASFIPTALGGEAAMPAEALKGARVLENVGKNALLGGVYNQSQGYNPALGFALGGALTPGLARTGINLLKGGGKAIGSLVTEPVMQKFFSQGQAPGDVLSSAEGVLKNKYQDAKNLTKDKYEQAQMLADASDSALNTGKKSPLSYQINSYSNNDYLKILGKIKADLKEQQASPQVVATVNKWIKTAPNSFSDAINARKAINSSNVNYTDTSFNSLKDSVNKARGALVDSVNSNIAKHVSVPEVNAFGNAWKDANEHYQNEQIPYTQTFKNGVLKDNKNLSDVLKLGGNTTGGDILKQFVPNGSTNDVNNLNHLGNLLGDHELAKNAAKAFLMKNGYNADGTPAASFLTKYKNLSPNLKQYLFSPDEQQALTNAQSTVSSKAGKKSSMLGKIGNTLLGGAAGSAIGHAAGMPWELGFATGSGIVSGGKKLAQTALEPKSLSDYNKMFLGQKRSNGILSPTSALKNKRLGSMAGIEGVISQ